VRLRLLLLSGRLFVGLAFGCSCWLLRFSSCVIVVWFVVFLLCVEPLQVGTPVTVYVPIAVYSGRGSHGWAFWFTLVKHTVYTYVCVGWIALVAGCVGCSSLRLPGYVCLVYQQFWLVGLLLRLPRLAVIYVASRPHFVDSPVGWFSVLCLRVVPTVTFTFVGSVAGPSRFDPSCYGSLVGLAVGCWFVGLIARRFTTITFAGYTRLVVICGCCTLFTFTLPLVPVWVVVYDCPLYSWVTLVWLLLFVGWLRLFTLVGLPWLRLYVGVGLFCWLDCRYAFALVARLLTLLRWFIRLNVVGLVLDVHARFGWFWLLR